MVCEPFTQWVLEDDFGGGRPPFEDVGVQMVDDVEPYELMKLRLLNASHQALCYLGFLAGYRYAHEVCQDPLFVDFLLAYMDRRGDADAAAGARGRPRRVQAPAHRAVRQPRGPRHPRPAVRGELGPHPQVAGAGHPRATCETGGEIERSALVVASWARYAEGVDEQGEPIEVVDRLARQAGRAAAATTATTRWSFISDRELFGDLASDERFVEAYTRRAGLAARDRRARHARTAGGLGQTRSMTDRVLGRRGRLAPPSPPRSSSATPSTGAVVREGRAPHPDGTAGRPRRRGGQASGGRPPRAARRRRGDRRRAVSSTAWSLSTRTGEVVRTRRCCGTTPAPRDAAAELVAELGGPQAWAEAVGTVPLASIHRHQAALVAEHEPQLADAGRCSVRAARTTGLTAHDWMTHRLGGRSVRDRRDHHRPRRRVRAPATGRRPTVLPDRPA